MSSAFKIDFEPIGRRVPYRDGASILEAARDAGVCISSFCGGKGTCGKCKIRVTSGKVSALTENEKETLSEEEISQGYRLACLTTPYGAINVHIPSECLVVSQRLNLTGKDKEVAIDPVIQAYDITLSPPSLNDIRADQARLLDYLAENHELKDINIDLTIQRQLPYLLRANGFKARIGLRGNEVVTACGPGTKLLGLAVDVGSTKIAAYLADLHTGEVLAAKGRMNSQIAYGDDIMTRLTFALEVANGGETLRQVITQDINQLLNELCAEMDCTSDTIADAVIVGNTAMHHLFLGLPIKQLALAPYVPAVSGSVDIKSRDLGLSIAPGAYVHILPNIAGFVGADHVAMLLATGIYESKKTVLGLDIGTNTEISLSVQGRIWSCSCASGPAFEGAHIKDGMRASGGAIERIKIANSLVEFHTINNESPVGICGSGILDAIAQLYEAGILNHKGKLRPHSLVRDTQNGREFVLVPSGKSGSGKDITLTEKDISEVQLAKGAIFSGMDILFSEANISWNEVDEGIIAGAFGSYIDVSSAITIGMFPPIPMERFIQVGNAAGVGAKLALISKKQRELAKDISRKVNYVELTNYPRYKHTFAQALWFPPVKSSGPARSGN